MARTKVDAIRMVMEEIGGAGGFVFLHEIYEHIGKYYKNVDAAKDWKAGVRGVLYREIRNGRNFVKAHDLASELPLYGLKK